MRKLFSENNFFEDTCSLMSHVDTSQLIFQQLKKCNSRNYKIFLKWIHLMKRCCQSLVVFSQIISRSKSKEKGKVRGCGKYLNKEQNKEFAIICCRRCVSMIENHVLGYFYRELFSKGNEEKCTAFQTMVWPLILH